MGPTHPVPDRDRDRHRHRDRDLGRDRRGRRTRRRIARHRVPLHRRLRPHPAALRYWLAVAVLAWVLASMVGHAVTSADDAQRRWGRTTKVWVTDRALRPGDRLTGAIHAQRWPNGIVPPAAVDVVAPEARAAVPLDPGAPLTRSAIDPTGRGGPGRRTMAVALPDARLPVSEGDRVDVWATADPSAAGAARSRSRRVATDAVVVSSSARSVVLAVPSRQVAPLAEAAATDILALVGKHERPR